MRLKNAGGPGPPVRKTPLLQRKDLAEYQRTRSEIVKVLERTGGYEPAVDDIYIDQIVRTSIYAKKSEIYLDSGTVTVDTYSRVADVKLKLSKIVENAFQQLALARRDRLGKQTEASLTNELKEAMLRTLKSEDQ